MGPGSLTQDRWAAETDPGACDVTHYRAPCPSPCTSRRRHSRVRPRPSERVLPLDWNREFGVLLPELAQGRLACRAREAPGLMPSVGLSWPAAPVLGPSAPIGGRGNVASFSELSRAPHPPASLPPGGSPGAACLTWKSGAYTARLMTKGGFLNSGHGLRPGLRGLADLPRVRYPASCSTPADCRPRRGTPPWWLGLCSLLPLQMGRRRVLVVPGATAGDIQTHPMRKTNLPFSSSDEVVPSPLCRVCFSFPPSASLPWDPAGRAGVQRVQRLPPEPEQRKGKAISGPRSHRPGLWLLSVLQASSWLVQVTGAVTGAHRRGDRPAFWQREQQDEPQGTSGLISHVCDLGGGSLISQDLPLFCL